MRAFDYSQLQTWQWDSEILGLVAQIHEFKGRQESYLKQRPAVLDKLIDIAKVQSTEASNKIEGIVTTNTPNRFFSRNSFYTTAANRMSRHVFTNAITNEDVIELCQKNR